MAVVRVGFSRLVWLLLLGMSVAAHAQPAPEPLPFVDQSGWVRGSLNYSAVVARFGEPPVAHVSSESRTQRYGDERGGHLVLAYPDLGLSFMVERQHRAAADPIVDSMRLTEPWVRSAPVNASTGPPQRREGPRPAPRWIVAGTGLHVGMPATAFDALVASRHRIDTDYRTKDGNGSLTLDDAEWGGRRGVSVVLDRGQVSAVTFESTARPFWASARRLVGPVLMIVLALAAGTLWQRARGRIGLGAASTAGTLPVPVRRSAPMPRPHLNRFRAGHATGPVQSRSHGIQLTLGGLCLAAGMGLAWVCWRTVQNSGDPYARLGALFVGAAAAGALMIGLAIFATMRQSAMGTVARGLLTLLVALLVVGTVVGKFIK